MITKERAREYLETQGIDLPDSLLDDLLVIVGAVSECLADNYPVEVANLISLYLLTLLSFAQYTRFISSERAPSGASRSFRFEDGSTKWAGIRAMLDMLDSKGCATELIPESPFEEVRAALFIGRGGCMHGG